MIEWLVIIEDKATTCTTICKDGWRGLSDVKIVYNSALQATSSKISTFISNWQAQTSGGVAFDIRPTTSFAYTAEDPPTSATDNVSQTDGTTANLCKENWLVSGNTNTSGSPTIYGYACVQYEGTVYRLFSTGDTGATNDMILGYKTYKVRGRFGPSTLTVGNAVYEYADRDVDFTTFQQPELTAGAVNLLTQTSFAFISILALIQ